MTSDNKKRLAFLVIVFLFFFVAFVFSHLFINLVFAQVAGELKDAQITVQWDADTSNAERLDWQKLHFFVRSEGGSYDYSQPTFILDQIYEGGKSTPTQTAVTYKAEALVSKTYYMVVRAFAVHEGENLESVDSEEVSWTMDMTRPLEVTDFKVEIVDGNYVFTWTKPDTDRIKDFQVRWSAQENTGFKYSTRLGDKLLFGDEAKVVIPIADFWADKEVDVAFVEVQSWTKEGVSSKWSNRVKLTKPVIVIVDAPQGIQVLILN